MRLLIYLKKYFKDLQVTAANDHQYISKVIEPKLRIKKCTFVNNSYCYVVQEDCGWQGTIFWKSIDNNNYNSLACAKQAKDNYFNAVMKEQYATTVIKEEIVEE